VFGWLSNDAFQPGTSDWYTVYRWLVSVVIQCVSAIVFVILCILHFRLSSVVGRALHHC